MTNETAFRITMDEGRLSGPSPKEIAALSSASAHNRLARRSARKQECEIFPLPSPSSSPRAESTCPPGQQTGGHVDRERQAETRLQPA